MRPPPSWLVALAGLVLGALLVAFLPASALFHPPGHDHAAHDAPTGERYACPMMCFIGQRPGTCPVCGMQMNAVTAGELSPTQTRRMGLETTTVVAGPALATVRAYGIAEYDNRHTRLVIPRVAGRIVRRFDATFGCCEIVNIGDPVIELYSPEVIAAQGELEAAIQLGEGALVVSIRERFARWNLVEVADDILAGKPPRDTVIIRSPFSGSANLSEEEMINELLAVGREVAADTPLLRLVDPDRLTLIVQVPEPRANWIREGQRVHLESDDAGPLPQVKAEVGRVFAEINPTLRSREVRLFLEGARAHLSPGSLVSARFAVALGPDLKPAHPTDRATWGEFALVPKSAVLSTGVRHVAWRLANRDSSGAARFELAPLSLGPRLEDENGNDLYVVRAGLAPGDVVATQAAFLIDSQAQLAGTPSLLFPLGATAPAAHAH
jgi:Cu(I)/Ag(I) efflux system membrane fusion protein